LVGEVGSLQYARNYAARDLAAQKEAKAKALLAKRQQQRKSGLFGQRGGKGGIDKNAKGVLDPFVSAVDKVLGSVGSARLPTTSTSPGYANRRATVAGAKVRNKSAAAAAKQLARDISYGYVPPKPRRKPTPPPR
jgi:hypothetical protein